MTPHEDKDDGYDEGDEEGDDDDDDDDDDHDECKCGATSGLGRTCLNPKNIINPMVLRYWVERKGMDGLTGDGEAHDRSYLLI